jgi:CRISPR system Cascade subunit CasD
MKSILLKFAGPLQSWGTDSNFETRRTDSHPSKSAVIGMISASLGLKRNVSAQIEQLNNLDFAVRVDQPGRLLKDYHTVHKYKNDGSLDRTYVTNRYYLEDAIFLVAIASGDDSQIEYIYEALKKPYFQQFMGKRSLPLPADFLQGIYNKKALDLLKEVEWQASQWYISKHSKNAHHISVYADSDLIEGQNSRLRRDRVASFSQENRQFGFRSETGITIDVKMPSFFKDEHDAFSALGGI